MVLWKETAILDLEAAGVTAPVVVLEESAANWRRMKAADKRVGVRAERIWASMGLFELLGISPGGSGSKGEDLGLMYAELSRHMEGMAPGEIKKITGYAGLLGKVAAADMEISLEEVAGIRQILISSLRLSGSQADFLLTLITEHRVQLFSLEDHVYSRLINECCDRVEKRQLLEALFSVAAVDRSVSQEEDATLWTIAKSLMLSHKEFIAERKQYAEHLDVLK